MTVRTGKILWDVALKNNDNNYARYIRDRDFYSGFRPIERLSNVGQYFLNNSCKAALNCNVWVERLLECNIFLAPKLLRRLTSSQVLASVGAMGYNSVMPARTGTT